LGGVRAFGFCRCRGLVEGGKRKDSDGKGRNAKKKCPRAVKAILLASLKRAERRGGRYQTGGGKKQIWKRWDKSLSHQTIKKNPIEGPEMG